MRRSTISRACSERARGAAILVVGALAISCSFERLPGLYVPFDAGPLPADSGRDAPAVDAHRIPTREGWRFVEGLPAGCDVWIADDPEAVASLEWSDCITPSESCRALVPSEEPRYARFVRVEGEQWDPARGEATFFWWWEKESAERDYVLADTSGRTYAVWRFVNHSFSTRCDPSGLATGDGRVAVVISTGSGSGDDIVLAGSIDDGGALERIATLTEDDIAANFVQELEVTEQAIGVSTAAGGQALRIEWDGRKTRLAGDPASGLYLRDAHQQTLFLNEAAPRGRLQVEDGAGQRVLVDPGDASYRVAVPRVDGVDLVWQREYAPAPDGPGAVELWASPYTTDPTRVEPRRVAVLPLRGVQLASEVAHGRALIAEGRDTLGVYALDGSEHTVLRLPEGIMIVDAFATRDDVVAVIGEARLRQAQRLELHRFDSLPPR